MNETQLQNRLLQMEAQIAMLEAQQGETYECLRKMANALVDRASRPPRKKR